MASVSVDEVVEALTVAAGGLQSLEHARGEIATEAVRAIGTRITPPA